MLVEILGQLPLIVNLAARPLLVPLLLVPLPVVHLLRTATAAAALHINWAWLVLVRLVVALLPLSLGGLMPRGHVCPASREQVVPSNI